MPITKSAKKALRKNRRKTIINRLVKEQIKIALKAMRKKPTAKKLIKAEKTLDQAAKKKVIHKNKAARLKSRLRKLLK